MNWKRSIPHGERWGGCGACVYLRADTSCIAFPTRIPLLIASGEIDHLVPRPGQVGETVFERGVPAFRARRTKAPAG